MFAVSNTMWISLLSSAGSEKNRLFTISSFQNQHYSKEIFTQCSRTPSLNSLIALLVLSTAAKKRSCWKHFDDSYSSSTKKSDKKSDIRVLKHSTIMYSTFLGGLRKQRVSNFLYTKIFTSMFSEFGVGQNLLCKFQSILIQLLLVAFLKRKSINM